MNKVLVLSPHLDDEVLGCGMAIAQHVQRGDQVEVLPLTRRPLTTWTQESHEAQRAQQALGYQLLHLPGQTSEGAWIGAWPDTRLYEHLADLIRYLEVQLRLRQPDICYVPHAGDTNQDHRTVFTAAQVALRPHGAYGLCKQVLCYEIPSGTECAWPAQVPKFTPNAFIAGEPLLEAKLAAWGCYTLQQRPLPNPRAMDNVQALARYRGARFGVSAAEAFEIQYLQL